jgi:hypothetical protein
MAVGSSGAQLGGGGADGMVERQCWREGGNTWPIYSGASLVTSR